MQSLALLMLHAMQIDTSLDYLCMNTFKKISLIGFF